MESEEVKEQAKAAVDDMAEEILGLSLRIQANPETAYEEVQAARWVADVLERHGFGVQRGLGGLETAFVASMTGQEPGPVIALIAEYDALPGVGHGCGHNLIAAGAAGAALGLSAVMPRLQGVLKVFGTPAEKCTSEPGGKIRLIDAGTFGGGGCMSDVPSVDGYAAGGQRSGSGRAGHLLPGEDGSRSG